MSKCVTEPNLHPAYDQWVYESEVVYIKLTYWEHQFTGLLEICAYTEKNGQLLSIIELLDEEYNSKIMINTALNKYRVRRWCERIENVFQTPHRDFEIYEELSHVAERILTTRRESYEVHYHCGIGLSGGFSRSTLTGKIKPITNEFKRFVE